jgi:hypothetical protein
MRGIKEVKDWGVPAPLLRILAGFPLDISVHGPSEFEDCDLLFLDVEGKPVGPQVQKGLDRIVDLRGVLVAKG